VAQVAVCYQINTKHLTPLNMKTIFFSEISVIFIFFTNHHKKQSAVGFCGVEFNSKLLPHSHKSEIP